MERLTMQKIYHMSLSVSRIAKNPRAFVGAVSVDGNQLQSADEVRRWAQYNLDRGIELLPLAECEGHDPIKGCPGHPIEGD